MANNLTIINYMNPWKFVIKKATVTLFAVLPAMLPAALVAEKLPDFLGKVQLHNFDGFETTPDGQGVTLYRLPAEVRSALSPEGARQITHARSSEIRFVLNEGAKLEDVVIHLKSNRASQVMYYRGDELVGRIKALPKKKDAELYIPPSMRETYKVTKDDQAVEYTLKPSAMKPAPQPESSSGETPPKQFSPEVHRVLFNSGVITLTDIEGDLRPPREDEVPPVLVSYGTSISMGAAATSPDLSFTARTARALGMSLRNFGVSGNAFCEPEMADYLAKQPGDLFLFEISVNMVGNNFEVDEFRKRATYLIDAVAKAHPQTPVVCISILPYGQDRNEKAAARPREFRAALEEICQSTPHQNVHFVDGTKLLSFEGLAKDNIHPTDAGHAEIAAKLVPQIQQILNQAK